eukprot:4979144-Prymnesium_polylepis.1
MALRHCPAVSAGDAQRPADLTHTGCLGCGWRCNPCAELRAPSAHDAIASPDLDVPVNEFLASQRRRARPASDRRLRSTCHARPERRARRKRRRARLPLRARRACGEYARAAHPQRASRPSSPDEEAWSAPALGGR